MKICMRVRNGESVLKWDYTEGSTSIHIMDGGLNGIDLCVSKEEARKYLFKELDNFFDGDGTDEVLVVLKK